MSAHPRAALSQFVAALERHLEACAGRSGEDDPSVIAAYDDLADAFEAYDAALYDAFGEMTPMDIYVGPEDDDEFDDEDDEDDDGSAGATEESLEALDVHDDEDGDESHLYAGLDDDFDVEEDRRS